MKERTIDICGEKVTVQLCTPVFVYNFARKAWEVEWI